MLPHETDTRVPKSRLMNVGAKEQSTSQRNIFEDFILIKDATIGQVAELPGSNELAVPTSHAKYDTPTIRNLLENIHGDRKRYLNDYFDT